MRHLFLILTTTVVLISPALAAKPDMDQQSPELRQCIQVCMQEKDATAREACDVKCVQADAKLRRQNIEIPIIQGNQPQK